MTELGVNIDQCSENQYSFQYELLGEPVNGININDLYVNKEVRRRDVGSEILSQLIKSAQEQFDIEYVVVNMGRDGNNDGGTESFLESHGFTIIEKENDHITAEKEL